MKKFLWLFILCLIWIPNVDAKTLISSSAPDFLTNGVNYEYTIGSDQSFTTLDLNLEYDSNVVEIISIDGINGTSLSNVGSFSSSPIHFQVNNPTGANMSNGYAKVTLRIKDTATGNYSNFVIHDNAGVEESYGMSLSYNVKSSDATLSSVSFSEGTLTSNFDPNNENYTLVVPETITLIDVSAATANYNATIISGIGNVNVSTQNQIVITVQAENGNQKNYTFAIQRQPEEQSSDASLKSLVSTLGNIEFKPNIYEYHITIPYVSDDFNIMAEANDEAAIVSISGLGNLEVGESTVVVTVTAENGTTQDYIIYVTRLDETETEENLSNNNFLKTLTIEGYNITFDPNTTSYQLRVENWNSLNITAIPDDENSEIAIIGNENLQEGSTVYVVVTAANGENKAYSITVTMDMNNTNVMNVEDSTNMNQTIMIIIVITVIIMILLGIIIWKKKHKKVKNDPISSNSNQNPDII